MVFNSLTFLVFFAILLCLHNLPLPWTVKKVQLLLASYLFYAGWNPPFVALLMISAVADFYLANWVGKAKGNALRRALLCVSLALNLGLLGYFKYGGFLLANFVRLASWFGIVFHPAAPDIILPLGISFYTFETVSYLVDVYRRKIEPWDSLLDYSLFLTFCPHLVAGPIVRANDFLPQCRKAHRATSRQMGWGLALMVVGLFEKMILADAILTPVADRVYASWSTAGFADAWIGTLAFAGQIFFDFAGYSTCGIGAALCLGFALTDNFHAPYAAIGFSDFWRRWHISLSSWLRDYLYIPLGGNRSGEFRSLGNLMITMLLGGLWHGASWHFVAWGGLHGTYLVGERFARRLWGGMRVFSLPVMQLGLVLLTFGLTCATWVLFRVSGTHAALHMFRQMLVPVARAPSLISRGDATWVLALTVALLAGHWLMRDTTLEHVASRMPTWMRVACLSFLLICLIFTPGDDRAFIYFQF